MSNTALHWAWQQTTGGPAQKIVLITLADLADEEHSCWPSPTYISENTEVSERSVRRHLKHLEAAGLIRKERRYGGYGARLNDRYYLDVEGQISATRALVAPFTTPAKPQISSSPANLAGNDQEATAGGGAKAEKPQISSSEANLAGDAAAAAPLAANCGRYIKTPQKDGISSQIPIPVESKRAREGNAGLEPLGAAVLDAELAQLHPSLSIAALETELRGRVQLQEIYVQLACQEILDANRQPGGLRNPAAYIAKSIVADPDRWKILTAPRPAGASAWAAEKAREAADRSACDLGDHDYGDARLPEIQRAHCIVCGQPRRDVDPAFRELENEIYEVSNQEGL